MYIMYEMWTNERTYEWTYERTINILGMIFMDGKKDFYGMQNIDIFTDF